MELFLPLEPNPQAVDSCMSVVHPNRRHVNELSGSVRAISHGCELVPKYAGLTAMLLGPWLRQVLMVADGRSWCPRKAPSSSAGKCTSSTPGDAWHARPHVKTLCCLARRVHVTPGRGKWVVTGACDTIAADGFKVRTVVPHLRCIALS